MPGYGYGSFGAISSSDITAGRQYTRMRGPILLGQQESTLIAGMGSGNINPPHLVNISSASVNFINAVSSFATGVATSSSNNQSTGGPTALLYFTQTTGAGNIIAAGSTANAPVGLPGGLTAPALLWDAAAKTLAIFDPASATWMWPHQLGSSGTGNTITWSASSS